MSGHLPQAMESVYKSNFLVNEKRLRKYVCLFNRPVIVFIPNTTKVTFDMDDSLQIESETPSENVDESVHMHIVGTRTFKGVEFNTDTLEVTGLQNPDTKVYFETILKHMLYSFERLCSCGGIVDCFCDAACACDSCSERKISG